jgi:hypothetical protein
VGNQTNKSHPNLNEDYFENIDTKEKAYWLGFLYADGFIKVEKNGTRRIGISLHRKDEIIINNFIQSICGNIDKKFHRKDKDQFYILLSSKKMVNDLIKQGCVENKTKKFRFPKLDNRCLDLSFLLGYYDGDGQQYTTRLASASKKFIEDIIKKFNLPFNIEEIKSSGNINGRKINGHAQRICIGSELFNEMMDNYQDSLPRKRKHFCTEEERIEKIKINAWNPTKIKFNITKEELEKLVWEMPSQRIAEKYGVSGRLITKRCSQWGISKPPRGYWAKKRSTVKH